MPEENKQWVKKLAEKLETDGIEVVIDYKDLKLGHDKYAFMERMVSDPSIDKVLIICNSGYKKKADKREGGVGDESIIITPQVFGKAEQKKFIPVVNERDVNGEPYLPIYLASRMYADLTDFSDGYKNLIETITDNDMTTPHLQIDSKTAYVEKNGALTSDSEKYSRYVKAKELDKKVVLDLEKPKTKVSEFSGVQDLRLCFKNITENQATSVDIIPSESLVKKMEGTVWKRNQESNAGVIITQYDAMIGDINVNEKGEFQYMLRYKTYNSHFLLICFCVKTKSIYGIETVQLFNIVITGGIINQVFIETEY